MARARYHDITGRHFTWNTARADIKVWLRLLRKKSQL